MGRLLYLIRHGRSDFGWTGERFVGSRGEQWDPPLSDEGREQAELLASRLQVMELEPFVVYSSPLRRAAETARTFADRAGVEISLEDELAEANIGGWEGVPFEEIVGSDPEILDHLRHQRPIWRYGPGAEAADDFRARVRHTIETMLDRHPHANVLAFVHGGVINAYCGELLGLPQEMFFLPENTSVNSVEVDGPVRRVRFLNDVLHLTDPHFFRDDAAYTPADP
jgi:broad specificity phosphatase PhoE